MINIANRFNFTNPIQATFRTNMGDTVTGPGAHFLGAIMMGLFGASEEFVKKAAADAKKNKAADDKTTMSKHIVKSVKPVKADEDSKSEKKADEGTQVKAEEQTQTVWRQVNLMDVLERKPFMDSAERAGERLNSFVSRVSKSRSEVQQDSVEDAVVVSETTKTE